MRSELISEAMAQVPNRFLLAKLLAEATRSLQRPKSRINDTTNDVLVRFSRSIPIADVQQPYKSRRFGSPPEAIHSNTSLEVIRVLGI